MYQDQYQSPDDRKLRAETLMIKQLGDQMGYGHLMSLASSLWRKKLVDSKTPIEGAFVPTCIPFIEKEYQEMTIREAENYDKIVEKYVRR